MSRPETDQSPIPTPTVVAAISIGVLLAVALGLVITTDGFGPFADDVENDAPTAANETTDDTVEVDDDGGPDETNENDVTDDETDTRDETDEEESGTNDMDEEGPDNGDEEDDAETDPGGSETETSTLTVEVVTDDTGEPIESEVRLRGPADDPSDLVEREERTLPTGEDGMITFENLADGHYEVYADPVDYDVNNPACTSGNRSRSMARM